MKVLLGSLVSLLSFVLTSRLRPGTCTTPSAFRQPPAWGRTSRSNGPTTYYLEYDTVVLRRVPGSYLGGGDSTDYPPESNHQKGRGWRLDGLHPKVGLPEGTGVKRRYWKSKEGSSGWESPAGPTWGNLPIPVQPGGIGPVRTSAVGPSPTWDLGGGAVRGVCTRGSSPPTLTVPPGSRSPFREVGGYPSLLATLLSQCHDRVGQGFVWGPVGAGRSRGAPVSLVWVLSGSTGCVSRTHPLLKTVRGSQSLTRDSWEPEGRVWGE